MKNLFSVLSDLMSTRQWVNRLIITLFVLFLLGLTFSWRVKK